MPLLFSGVKTPLFPWVLAQRVQRKTGKQKFERLING